MRAHSYVLRAATNADQPAIWELISSVLRSYGIMPDLRTTDSDLADIEASYTSAGGHFFALLDGARLIGTVALAKTSSTACELCRMYLSPEYRRQGLGRQLLDKALSEAKSSGYAEVHLKTAGVLVEAIKLYESVGFERTCSIPVSENCNLAMTMKLT